MPQVVSETTSLVRIRKQGVVTIRSRRRQPIRLTQSSASGTVTINDSAPRAVLVDRRSRARIRIIREGLRRVVVSTRGKQGPRGFTGPPGSAVDDVGISAGPLGSPRLLINDGTGLRLADITNVVHGDQIVGVGLNSVTAAGEEVTIRRTGKTEFAGSNFTPGLPVYVGLGGVLTQTLPSPNEQAWRLVIGHAISSTKVFLKVGNPIFTC